MGGEKWDQKALLSRAAAGDEDAVNELVQKKPRACTQRGKKVFK